MRVRTGRFVVDGPQGVREAVRYAAERIVDVYVTPEAAQRTPRCRRAGPGGQDCRVHEVSDEVMAAMAGTDTPQGLLAVVRDEPVTLDDGPRRQPPGARRPRHVRDPGNAGTVIRGADALGADAVLVSEASVEVLAPKVVRSTAGSLFHVPVVTGLEPPGDLRRAAGSRSFGCSPPTAPARPP